MNGCSLSTGRRAPRARAPGDELVPPDVAPVAATATGCAGVAHDDDGAHARHARDRLVGGRLRGHRAAAAHERVGRDQRDRARVLEPARDRAAAGSPRRSARRARRSRRWRSSAITTSGTIGMSSATASPLRTPSASRPSAQRATSRAQLGIGERARRARPRPPRRSPRRRRAPGRRPSARRRRARG